MRTDPGGWVRLACGPLLLIALAAAPMAAQGPTPPTAAVASALAAVDRATAAWKTVHTVRGGFQQTLTNSLVGQTATAHGDFQEQRPNKLSIRFADQQGDAIVADGKYVWIYLPTSAPGQVIRRVATDPGYTPVDFDDFLDSPRTRFDITDRGKDNVDGKPAHVVSLVPKAGTTSTFSRATVWIGDADALVHQIEVVESAAVTRRIHLTGLAVNVPVDNSTFVFTVPKGVKIITDR